MISSTIGLDAFHHYEEILPTLASSLKELLLMSFQSEKLVPFAIRQHARLVLLEKAYYGSHCARKYSGVKPCIQLTLQAVVWGPRLSLAMLLRESGPCLNLKRVQLGPPGHRILQLCTRYTSSTSGSCRDQENNSNLLET